MTTTTQTEPTAGFGTLVGQALLGGAVAAVANLVLFFATRALGVDFTGEFQPGQAGELPIPAVAIASVVPAFFAALVAWAAQRFAGASAARVFVIIAVVFCLLSLGGPLGVPQLGTAAKVVMNLMHVVAAVGIALPVARAL